ncbi:hypothetical protein EW146_g1582 [Bondarzewia mesenterica]|uniref:Cyclin N-terminal domain-containing protein n=1 Tax=Bondarzewia mesenterica TaxID=1095465 RepID=A0A4S4M3G2_9AGAM|nr:hypothetical protein EW146_g1582 [Bondarzewia mesenterica]
MASQTRRVTRTTRTIIVKDENANARPRIPTRIKPPSNSEATVKSRVATRATSQTISTRAKSVAKDAASEQDPAAQGKRKRSALGEVAGFPNRTKGITVKGKSKEENAAQAPAPNKLDGAVLKSKTKTAASTTAVPRQPLRTVLAPAPVRTFQRVTRASTAASASIAAGQLRVEAKRAPAVAPPKDDAMVIDPPALHVPPRRVATRPALAPKTTHREPVPAARSRVFTRVKQDPEEDEAEANRVFKKRRTSSDAPDEQLAPVKEEEEHDELALQEEEAQRAVAELSRHLTQIEREEEADPNEGWENLDDEDDGDPLMVSEYVVEIFEYLKEVEQTMMPNPNYMDNQKDLAWKMRGILTDWLIQVHMRFRLLPETLFLAVNTIDRFLTARVVSLAKLQLVGITCMFIASKVEEVVAPSANNFLFCADSSYTEEEILQAEKYILKTLEWNMNCPNPINFLRRVSKADGYNVQVRTLGKYLLEIQAVEWRLVGTPPSLLAAASIWLARLILGRDGWTPNLAHYSSYPESALVPTANLMLNYVLRPIRHPSFFKKYASKRFLKASTFVREWALQRWREGEQVSLETELPSLKALIRAARDRAVAAGIDPDEGVVLHTVL